MPQAAYRMSSAEVRRHIKAVTDAGLSITRTEFSSGGGLILHHTKEMPTADQAYEAWKGRKDAHSA